MFQIGFLEILIIFIFGLIIIGPKRLPEVTKTIIKFYKKIENKFVGFKKDIEDDKQEYQIIYYIKQRIILLMINMILLNLRMDMNGI